ncbi:DUF2157 domain-containing protein [Curvibacter sp. APW13]|uniref:DUF2157 domain-containing protein n=1 Tax=Curvibacter sp. APW13 TaxID=3077236 RepID=UPI0028DE039B|nr:DUF2157 domain-containing protein [Curvibacter sp. APW13]MDT8992010.1 DUF2157 domain-containing protein [Curvibacter sp. APW13]
MTQHDYEPTQMMDYGPSTLQSIPITETDLKEAARAEVITDAQAQALWRLWAHGEEAPPLARPVPTAAAVAPTQAALVQPVAAGPGFSFVNVLYYFGGMVAIGAMTLFITLGYQAMGLKAVLLISLAYALGALKVADHFKARALPVPAGLMATLAVVLVPLVLWCVQSLAGAWPTGVSRNYADYHYFIDWRWMMLEFGTLAAAAVMLWRYKLPFMVMPVAVTLWYMSMDVANGLMQVDGWDYQLMRDISLVFGLGTCAMAMWVDVRTRLSKDAAWRQDFAFWLYLFGAIMFWSSLSLRDSNSELGKALYAVLNVFLVLFGAAIGRRVFTVFGALGVAGYLGYLSHRVFQDSLLFPFALSLLGLGVVWLGVKWQRNEAAINAYLARWVPAGLRPRG